MRVGQLVNVGGIDSVTLMVAVQGDAVLPLKSLTAISSTYTPGRRLAVGRAEEKDDCAPLLALSPNQDHEEEVAFLVALRVYDWLVVRVALMLEEMFMLTCTLAEFSVMPNTERMGRREKGTPDE